MCTSHQAKSMSFCYENNRKRVVCLFTQILVKIIWLFNFAWIGVKVIQVEVIEYS